MSLLLIDDQGEFWRGDSRQLRAAFDSPYSGGEFVEYAIKNLGFVGVNLYGASCQLRFRPDFVTEKAISSLLQWLQQAQVDRVVMTTFEQAWRDELVQRAGAERRLAQLAARQPLARPEDLLSQPIPYATLDNRPEVADIIGSWRHLLTTYEAETLMRLLRSVFGERYVIARKVESTSKMVFQEMGDNMFPGYDPWRTCAIGAPLEEQPDRVYGRWIAKVYREAVDSDRPRVEAVDAIMRCPVKGRTRFRYKRLVFPIPETSDGPLVVGGSFTDTSIDLRVLTR
jgi:hypothetical protein